MKNWLLKSFVIAFLTSSIIFGTLTYQSYLSDEYYYTHVGQEQNLVMINKKTGQSYGLNTHTGKWIKFDQIDR